MKTDENVISNASDRRSFLKIGLAVAGVAAMETGLLARAQAQGAPSGSVLDVSADVKTIAGEPIEYPSTPEPVISSNILSIPPGGVTAWMIHPVQPYCYVLEGALTVEFAADGSRQTFRAGQAFLQTRTHWHRGRNDGTTPMRFLAVFVGAKGDPTILHPPSGKLVEESAPSK